MESGTASYAGVSPPSNVSPLANVRRRPFVANVVDDVAVSAPPKPPRPKLTDVHAAAATVIVAGVVAPLPQALENAVASVRTACRRDIRTSRSFVRSFVRRVVRGSAGAIHVAFAQCVHHFLNRDSLPWNVK